MQITNELIRKMNTEAAMAQLNKCMSNISEPRRRNTARQALKRRRSRVKQSFRMRGGEVQVVLRFICNPKTEPSSISHDQSLRILLHSSQSHYLAHLPGISPLPLVLCRYT